MVNFQPIYDIATICAQKGLSNAVMCPGSRCAPLSLAFVRHPNIKTRTFSDERSAGFIALGMAQQTKTPSILLCTSGTAAYNFAPSVAEAFFSQTPLIIFTADRPQEWIAQHDGQTIYQYEIFGRHVKKSYLLPQQYDHPDDQWYINRVINEAVNLANEEPKGPVHINAPFREPFYPEPTQKIEFSKNTRIIEEVEDYDLGEHEGNELIKELSAFSKILIVAGQADYDRELPDALSSITHSLRIPVVSDIISNTPGMPDSICHSDAFLGQAPDPIKQQLRPDLLITFGKSVISKNLKLFLRKFTPDAHWHIQPQGIASDPFQHVSKVIRTTPRSFFNLLKSSTHSLPIAIGMEGGPGLPAEVKTKAGGEAAQSAYLQLWRKEEERAHQTLQNFFPQDHLNEFEFVKSVIEALPEKVNLHLANSMSVRYANYIGLNQHHKNINVFSNRGTSGIDGCTSTAVGHCLGSDDLNVLITGDMAFFYDRNAFWHNYLLPNLRVILLNNHGGIIFKLIDGPSPLPEADEYFVTHQKLTAQKLCEEFDFDYIQMDEKKNVKELLAGFFKPGGKTKIIELETSIELNKAVFENFKMKIRKTYAT